ncbi:hypothetical protein BGX38DRAFT_36847 [Terfezia claveryi]|nr:hypothetical protein BGX38DRAFT_36847 [Terfezia claveryi]
MKLSTGGGERQLRAPSIAPPPSFHHHHHQYPPSTAYPATSVISLCPCELCCAFSRAHSSLHVIGVVK